MVEEERGKRGDEYFERRRVRHGGKIWLQHSREERRGAEFAF